MAMDNGLFHSHICDSRVAAKQFADVERLYAKEEAHSRAWCNSLSRGVPQHGQYRRESGFRGRLSVSMQDCQARRGRQDRHDGRNYAGRMNWQLIDESVLDGSEG